MSVRNMEALPPVPTWRQGRKLAQPMIPPAGDLLELHVDSNPNPSPTNLPIDSIGIIPPGGNPQQIIEQIF